MVESAAKLNDIYEDVLNFYHVNNVPDETEDKVVFVIQNKKIVKQHLVVLKKFIDIYDKKIKDNCIQSDKVSRNTTFMREVETRLQNILKDFPEVIALYQDARANKKIQPSPIDLRKKAELLIISRVMDTTTTIGKIAEKLSNTREYMLLSGLEQLLKGRGHTDIGIVDKYHDCVKQRDLYGRLLKAEATTSQGAPRPNKVEQERKEAEAKLNLFIHERYGTFVYKHTRGGVISYNSYIEYGTTKKTLEEMDGDDIKQLLIEKYRILKNIEAETVNIVREIKANAPASLPHLEELNDKIINTWAASAQDIIYQMEAIGHVADLKEKAVDSDTTIKGAFNQTIKYNIKKQLQLIIRGTTECVAVATTCLNKLMTQADILDKRISAAVELAHSQDSEMAKITKRYSELKTRYANREQEVWANLPDYKKEQIKKGSRSGRFVPANNMASVVDSIRKELEVLLIQIEKILPEAKTGGRISLNATKEGIDSLLTLINRENPIFNRQESINADIREKAYIDDINQKLDNVHKRWLRATQAHAYLLLYKNPLSDNIERLHDNYQEVHNYIVDIINMNPFQRKIRGTDIFVSYRTIDFIFSAPKDVLAPMLYTFLADGLELVEEKRVEINKKWGHITTKPTGYSTGAPEISSKDTDFVDVQVMFDELSSEYKKLLETIKNPEKFREGLDDKMYHIAVDARRRNIGKLKNYINNINNEVDKQEKLTAIGENVNDIVARKKLNKTLQSQANAIGREIESDKFSVKYTTEKPVYKVKTRAEIEKLFAEKGGNSILAIGAKIKAETEKILKGGDISWVAEMEALLVSSGIRVEDTDAIHRLNISKRRIVVERVQLLEKINLLIKDIKMARRYPPKGKLSDTYKTYLDKTEAKLYVLKKYYSESFLEILAPFYQEYWADYYKKNPKKPLKKYTPRAMTIEEAAKLEGWEPIGFYTHIHSHGLTHQIQYRFISNDPPVGRMITDEQPMVMDFDEHPYGMRPLPGFHGSLINMVRLHKRKATTRSYIIKGEVGDIVKFWSSAGFVYCEITAAAYDITKLAPPVGMFKDKGLNIQRSDFGYAQRTSENIAAADFTIAIASDFKTPGEARTLRESGRMNKPIIQIQHDAKVATESVKIVTAINDVAGKLKRAIIINGAGNTANKIVGGQEAADKYAYDLLKAVIHSSAKKFDIIGVRTGGQTGYDIAIAKAANKLGIPTLIHAARGHEASDAIYKDKFMIEVSSDETAYLTEDEYREYLSTGKVAEHAIYKQNERPILNYKRKEIKADKHTLYIFTDNCKRTSGQTPIEERSWYTDKYGSGLCYPSMTQAVARGLNNAYPISTMKDFSRTQWEDSEFEQFKLVINDEINDIKNARGKFSAMKWSGNFMEGDSKIGQGSISKLPPRLQEYLDNKLMEIGINQKGAQASIKTGSVVERDPNYRYTWGRYGNPSEPSFEVTTQAPPLPNGDRRFSALSAKFSDGESIEDKWYFDVRGWRADAIEKGLTKTSYVYSGKGSMSDLDPAQEWLAYKALWVRWARKNPELMEELRKNAYGRRLTDKFATTTVSQARALCEILNGDLSIMTDKILMPQIERLPSGQPLGGKITNVLEKAQAVDGKKALAKADLANKFIGFGDGVYDTDGKTNASSTQHYRIQAGLLANTGVYFKTDVVFVSVVGSRGGFDNAFANIFKTLAEVKRAVDGGAILLTDNKFDTQSSSYNIGEKELVKYLTSLGVSYTEVIHKGCLIGMWNKYPIHVVENKDNVFVTTNPWVVQEGKDGTNATKKVVYIYPNRQRLALDLERTHPGLSEKGQSDVDILDRADHVISIGYDRVVFGDHGAYIEMNYGQMQLGLEWQLRMKGGTAYYDEMYTPGHAKVYKQLRDVKNLKQPPVKTTNIHAWRHNVRQDVEGYADYIPGKFYVSVDDVKIRKHKGETPAPNIMVIEGKIPVLISLIGHFNNITETIDAKLTRYESIIFANISSPEVLEKQHKGRRRRNEFKPLSKKDAFAPEYATESLRRKAKIPDNIILSDGQQLDIENTKNMIVELYKNMTATSEEVLSIIKKPDSGVQRERIKRLTPPYKRLNKDREIIQIAIIRFNKMLGINLAAEIAPEPDLFISINHTAVKNVCKLIKDLSDSINQKIGALQQLFTTTRKDTRDIAHELIDLISERDRLLFLYNRHNKNRIHLSLVKIANFEPTVGIKQWTAELKQLEIDSKGGESE